jgi:hypothetical protein
METMFLVCAIVGGTLVVCQFLLVLVGFAGHGADVHTGDVHVGDFQTGHIGGDAHAGASHADANQHPAHQDDSATRGAADWFFRVLSFRTVVAAVALFGMTGKAATSAGFDEVTTLALAIGAGIAAMYAVHGLMSGLKSLDTDRTVRIERALGQPGTVYLSIPARRTGMGKIQLTLQNRLDELEAVTAGEGLPGGAKVKVIGIVGPSTVEVEALA